MGIELNDIEENNIRENIQNEITEETYLLDENGNLNIPGYSKRNNFIYNKENIGALKTALKEWNFYQISNGKLLVQINFYNIGLFSTVCVELCNMRSGKKISDIIVEPFTYGRNPMDDNADKPSEFRYVKNGKFLEFKVEERKRTLRYEGKAFGRRFAMKFELDMFPEHESLVTATPFEKPGRFFFTQKMNSMPTKGVVLFGKKKIFFSRQNTFTVLDWGRGVWPHSNMWYWANGTGRIGSDLFGFELTWGFGNTEAATATALFFNGKCHKIGAVHIENDPEDGKNWMQPWHITSEDGRLDITMKPFFDNETGVILLGLVGMKSHQVHGLWNGYAVLDDGRRIEIKDMYAFCEKVYNKW